MGTIPRPKGSLKPSRGKGTGRNSSHHQFFITIRGFKKGLNIAGDVVPGRNIKQAAKSRLKSTGQSLLQKAMDTVGTPGQRAIKEPAKRKKTRLRQTKQRNTSNDIFG
jgi:hypothetical protein